MDSDCLICFEAHCTAECPDRKPQHCPSCHIHIRHQSDHSSVCCMKQWMFQPYKDLSAIPPLQRYIIGCNLPFRFLYDGDWRKPVEGNQLASPGYDTIIRFRNENDFSVLTGSFAPIRIAIVVKENSKFAVKLILLASRERFIVVKALRSKRSYEQIRVENDIDFGRSFKQWLASKRHGYTTTEIGSFVWIEQYIFKKIRHPGTAGVGCGRRRKRKSYCRIVWKTCSIFMV